MRQRGFSLVELMVTIAILMMLILAAMPSIGTWLENTRIRDQADSLVNGLQAARAEAVRTNQEATFWLVSSSTPGAIDDTCAASSTSASWVVSFGRALPDGSCAAWQATTPPKIVASRPMGEDSGHVSVTALKSGLAPGATSVTFNGFGRIVNSAPIIEIRLDGAGGAVYRNLKIEVSRAGSVRVCDPAVSSSSDPRKC